MQQKLVYLHTDKNLKETEEILKQQGMEIILKCDSIHLHFSDMTEEEQLSYLKTIEGDLEHKADRLEIFDKELEIFIKRGNSFSKIFKENFNLIKNSRNTETIKRFKDAQIKFIKLYRLTSILTDYGFHSGYLEFNENVRCSCIIAKMGSDVIRYLEFKNDPVLTFTGPNATSLKSSLEKQF